MLPRSGPRPSPRRCRFSSTRRQTWAFPGRILPCLPHFAPVLAEAAYETPALQADVSDGPLSRGIRPLAGFLPVLGHDLHDAASLADEPLEDSALHGLALAFVAADALPPLVEDIPAPLRLHELQRIHRHLGHMFHFAN